MDVTGVITSVFLIGIVASAAARPVGEADGAFVARTISASPMSKDSRVQAHLTDCTLIIDQTIPTEKKRTVLPLARLDEHSFEVSEDYEWGWFVEVHTQQQQRDIKSGTAKWRAGLAIYYIHVSDEKNCGEGTRCSCQVVRSCRRTQHRPNQALQPTASRRTTELKHD